MAPNPFYQFLLDIFILSAVIITAYTCNFYYLVYVAARRRENYPVADLGTPTVTVQLPIYNEKYVARRLVDAVCAMDYPKNRLKIMILDDSDDETTILLQDTTRKYQQLGYQIQYVRRGTRHGYKAGALRHAMESTDTEFVAIFDADFMPPKWFLRKAIPHFSSPDIGLVQCRWGHVNEGYSAMTRAQAISLDFHFLVEQKAKSNSHLFMNFNGTAGIWRRECIDSAGGWHTATLVEDLDLSYRAQMKGWKCIFLPDLVVDAELPVQMNAVKRQQFRWAKGSVQCALKLLSDIVVKRKMNLGTKIQAFVQLTRHIVYPFMLMQFLTLPILLAQGINLYVVSFIPSITIAAYLLMGPVAYMMILQNLYGLSWRQKVKALPYLFVYSAGLSVNNTVAVFDALLGKKNVFYRTPKYGTLKSKDDWKQNAYNLPFTKVTLLEIFFAAYGVVGIMVSILYWQPIFAPIIAVQTLGYFYVSYMSLMHSRFKRHKSDKTRIVSEEERMANKAYKVAMAAMMVTIALGMFFAFYGYYEDIYPVDIMRGHLNGIMATSDPATMMAHLAAIQVELDGTLEKLPDNNNPVWLFPTPTTDFGRIHGDLEYMASSLDLAVTIPKNSAAYATLMLDVHSRADIVRSNLVEAIPFMYVSLSNISLTAVWMASIMGIFAILKRRKDKMAQLEQSGR